VEFKMNQNPPSYKKLYRSRKERIFAGVCGGLAEYFGIDPTWVRLLFIVFFFLGGAAFLIYILFWLLVPLSP
jgi:phage shock protein C